MIWRGFEMGLGALIAVGALWLAGWILFILMVVLIEWRPRR